METTRRGFVKSAALLAAGAGIGLPIIAGGPRRVLTEVRMILFSKDPIVIKAAIHADEAANIFAIDMPSVKARMPLSDVRDAMLYWDRAFNAVLTTPEETRRVAVRAYRDTDRFCIEEDRPDAAPCWIRDVDVWEAVFATA